MTEMMVPRPSPMARARWLWPLLLGSLSLNLLIGGVLLGQRLRPQAASLPPGIASKLAQEAAAPLIGQLSEAKRAQIRSIFEAHRGENRPLWQAVRERRAEVGRALGREPFDQAAYVAAMTRLIEAEGKARVAAQTTFAEVAAMLSPQERQDFLVQHRQLRQHLLGPQREGRRGERQGDPASTGRRPAE